MSLLSIWDAGCLCPFGHAPCTYCVTFDPDQSYDENVERIERENREERAKELAKEIEADDHTLEYFKKHGIDL